MAEKQQKTGTAEKPLQKNPHGGADASIVHDEPLIHSPHEQVKVLITQILTTHPYFRVQDPDSNLFSRALHESVIMSRPLVKRGAFLLKFRSIRQGLGKPAAVDRRMKDVRFMTESELVAEHNGVPLAKGLGEKNWRAFQGYDPMEQFCVLFVVFDPKMKKTIVSLHVLPKSPRDDFDRLGFLNRHILSCQCCYPFSGAPDVLHKGMAFPPSTMFEKPSRIESLKSCPHCHIFYVCVKPSDMSTNVAKHNRIFETHVKECDDDRRTGLWSLKGKPGDKPLSAEAYAIGVKETTIIQYKQQLLAPGPHEMLEGKEVLKIREGDAPMVRPSLDMCLRQMYAEFEVIYRGQDKNVDRCKTWLMTETLTTEHLTKLLDEVDLACAPKKKKRKPKSKTTESKEDTPGATAATQSDGTTKDTVESLTVDPSAKASARKNSAVRKKRVAVKPKVVSDSTSSKIQ